MMVVLTNLSHLDKMHFSILFYVIPASGDGIGCLVLVAIEFSVFGCRPNVHDSSNTVIWQEPCFRRAMFADPCNRVAGERSTIEPPAHLTESYPWSLDVWLIFIELLRLQNYAASSLKLRVSTILEEGLKQESVLYVFHNSLILISGQESFCCLIFLEL